MFGQAEGVRGNYKKNPNIYSQNAEYGEESKQQSTDTRIKTLDGVDKAVALDVTDAGIKAKQMSGSTKGMMGVADNIEGQQEFVNKTLAAAKNAEHRNQMLKDFENSGWTDANGKVNKGAFIAARAMLGANNMMASNSMGIGGSVVSGTIGATSDNITVKVDGVDSSASGGIPMSGGGSFRTKLSLTAGATALGYGVDAQAREISPSSIKAIPQEEGLLK